MADEVDVHATTGEARAGLSGTSGKLYKFILDKGPGDDPGPVKEGALKNAKWSQDRAAPGDKLKLSCECPKLDDSAKLEFEIRELYDDGEERTTLTLKADIADGKGSAAWEVPPQPQLHRDDEDAAVDLEKPKKKGATGGKAAGQKRAWTYRCPRYFFLAKSGELEAKSKKLLLGQSLEWDFKDKDGKSLGDAAYTVFCADGTKKTGKLADGHLSVVVPVGHVRVEVENFGIQDLEAGSEISGTLKTPDGAELPRWPFQLLQGGAPIDDKSLGADVETKNEFAGGWWLTDGKGQYAFAGLDVTKGTPSIGVPIVGGVVAIADDATKPDSSLLDGGHRGDTPEPMPDPLHEEEPVSVEDLSELVASDAGDETAESETDGPADAATPEGKATYEDLLFAKDAASFDELSSGGGFCLAFLDKTAKVKGPDDEKWAHTHAWPLKLLLAHRIDPAWMLPDEEATGGWYFEDVPDGATLRIGDEQNALLCRERPFGSDASLRWAKGLTRVVVECKAGDRMWTATVDLPETRHDARRGAAVTLVDPVALSRSEG